MKRSFSNGVCKIFATVACVVFICVFLSQVTIDVKVTKRPSGLIESVSSLVSGAVGTVKSIQSLTRL